MKIMTLVDNELGDWQGLYVDDDLILENHTLGVKQVLEALCDMGIVFDNIELTEDQVEELSYSLPKSLQEMHSKLEI